SENKHLLSDILKDEWNYEGFVVSDWRGTRSTEALNAGLDLEMPGPGKFLTKDKVLKELEENRLTINQLNDKVRRILRAYVKTGLLDHEKPDFNAELNSERHQLLARKVAEEAIVLLKNEANVLPFQTTIKKLAVIGPNAAEARLGGGGSASVSPFYAVSPLKGLQNYCGPETEIIFEEGCGLNGNLKVIDSRYLQHKKDGQTSSGLKAEYFSNSGLNGKPAVTSADEKIDFSWGWANPKPGVDRGNYSVRWSGQLLPPETGNYKIGVSAASGGFRLYIDDKLVFNEWTADNSENFEAELTSVNQITELDLQKDNPVDIRLEFYKRANRNFIRLEWEIPGINSIERAKQAAAKSDAVVIFAGLSNFFEGGNNDREDIVLPGEQNRLIREVAKVNPNTAVVLINGTPVAMPWIEDVNAVLEAYYPGQEGGNAIAKVLFGEVNPSGKLPETFPVKLSDNPAFGNYPGENNEVHYNEGIFVGYRHYDSNNVEPLFPFGHGLSYTTFEYDDLKITKNGESFMAEMSVQNTGNVAGAEVVQLYISHVNASEPRPAKELKQFRKITISPNEKQKITFEITGNDLSFFAQKQNKWIVEPGEFKVLIGSSSRDIRLSGEFSLK
ncbi:MAG: glycoside hydrolase family 3 C-terminal domain-containing protein, partial [Prolixibacteraceae bacterium]